MFTKKKRTAFVSVLKRLNIISSVADSGAQADRMWEKLLELALLVRSGGRHRKPSEILKTFIKSADTKQDKLSKDEKKKLVHTFAFLERAYKVPEIVNSRLATDQTHFYILAAALLMGDLLAEFKENVLVEKIAKFSMLIEWQRRLRILRQGDSSIRWSLSRFRNGEDHGCEATRRKTARIY